MMSSANRTRYAIFLGPLGTGPLKLLPTYTQDTSVGASAGGNVLNGSGNVLRS